MSEYIPDPEIVEILNENARRGNLEEFFASTNGFRRIISTRFHVKADTREQSYCRMCYKAFYKGRRKKTGVIFCSKDCFIKHKKKNTPRKYNHDEIVRLWSEGLHPKEIARIMGMDRSYTVHILRMRKLDAYSKCCAEKCGK